MTRFETCFRQGCSALFLAILTIATPTTARQPTIVVPVPPPVSAHRIGNWTVSADSDYADATTVNASGSAFGVVCGKRCIYYLDMQTRCEKGQTYPAMINSDAGSDQIVMRCLPLDGHFLLLFNADLASELETGGEIGFAVPLASGRFNVSRFSLEGAAEAIDAATRITDDLGKRGQGGLRDFTL